MGSAARAAQIEARLRGMLADYTRSQTDPDYYDIGVGEEPRWNRLSQIGKRFYKVSQNAGDKYVGGATYDPETGVFYDPENDTYYNFFGGGLSQGRNIWSGGPGFTQFEPPPIGGETGGGGTAGGETGTPPGKGTGIGTGARVGTGGWKPGQGTSGLPSVELSDPGTLKYFTDIFGPEWSDVISAVLQGLPAGMKVKGLQELETIYPMVRDAVSMEMQKRGLATGYSYLDQLRNDPTLQGASDLMAEILANPYTYDEQTVGLMKGAIADMVANQEAAMGERLRGLGATQGISTDSPMYASLASQQAMVRDINLAKMQRELDMEMAKQRQADRYSAVTGAGEFGGAYQTLLGGAYGNLANLQVGAATQPWTNPFQGLWQGQMAYQQLMDSDKTQWYETPWGVGLGAFMGTLGGSLGEQAANLPRSIAAAIA